MTPAIVVDSLVVQFGSFRAIDGFSVVINYGEVQSVIGPNGAGKSTLLDVISGVTRARTGSVVLDGQVDLSRSSQEAIAAGGVRRKFQKPSVFEALTVEENVWLGRGGGLWRRQDDRLADREHVAASLRTVGLAERAQEPAGRLSHGEKQWLEIAMVLSSDPKVLLLDEPVAGLSDEERERTAALVKSLRSPDRAIVVVEHDMGFVEKIADRITVMHEGRSLFEGPMAAVRNDARVVEVYLGR
ncbi:ATP-binding cassette domain-containing protein [Aurantimonas aggregata]|uniref:ATP-binding cassette domain-containing protein n=1 Tax=Aurantimonas aggregata TaxID=2047720 RepID=A0A6L9MJJ8_9HYPH|nr:ATP-binding cassette domain-containing protein [Aurantimonas aggregata]NDV87935.1 ATP-binding cassette domain-containing protein [Aurantimonas aggregata]